MPLITTTAADGTITDREGISLGEVHPGVETFLVVADNGNAVVYRQPTQAAADASVKAAEQANKAEVTEDAAEAADRASWKFDPQTGQPINTGTPTTVTGTTVLPTQPINPTPVVGPTVP
jgi:hypothetical protein